MAIFMLETDTVSSSASTLSSLASQVSSIASSVSGYDTSCEDFDFGSAKAAIAGNLEACATKVTNTANILNNVVSSHTSLQNSLKFEGSKEKEESKEQTTEEKPAGSTSTGGNTQTGGSSHSGGSTYTGGSSYSGGGSYVTPVVTPSISAPETTAPTGPVDINEKVEGIDHGTVTLANLSSIGKTIFESEDLAYNAAGYATIGGMFIVSCGKAFGAVGDEIEFTLSDGQKFKCIIGQIDESNGGKIKFFVNDKWKDGGEQNFQPQIGDYISKIQNLGSNTKYALGTTINSALDWATVTANDNTHGYSQQTRWGNPNYDCSSFVISSYEAAGIKVKEAGASYTGNMRNAFIKAGFEWIPGTPDVNKLQAGDVLLNEGTHTEMYYGNGLMIGAHGNSDGRDGDSGGNEINITKYSNKNWDGVLRYVGKNQSTSTSSGKVTPPDAPQVKLAVATQLASTTDNATQQETTTVASENTEENKTVEV